MYAMVEIHGKQYKAEEGGVLKVDRVAASEGDVLEFPKVLLLREDDSVKVGKPYLEGVTVKAVLEEHGRDPKIIVYKYKKRKNYRRKHGHRQGFSRIRVQEIAR